MIAINKHLLRQKSDATKVSIGLSDIFAHRHRDKMYVARLQFVFEPPSICRKAAALKKNSPTLEEMATIAASGAASASDLCG